MARIIGGLARADALAIVPEGVARVAQGDELTVMDLRGGA